MKRLLLLSALLLTSTWAYATPQFLRWYVDQDEDPIPWTFAIINVLENGAFIDSLRIPGKEGEEDWREPTIGTNYQLFDAQSTVLEEWQGAAYSFQLELYNKEASGEFTVVATGPAVSYEALSKTAIADYGDATPYQWMALGPAPVPEPTGGVLVLLGAALLGLRRKKVDA